jgi:hypothetical protein
MNIEECTANIENGAFRFATHTLRNVYELLGIAISGEINEL